MGAPVKARSGEARGDSTVPGKRSWTPAQGVRTLSRGEAQREHHHPGVGVGVAVGVGWGAEKTKFYRKNAKWGRAVHWRQGAVGSLASSDGVGILSLQCLGVSGPGGAPGCRRHVHLEGRGGTTPASPSQ